MCDKRIQVIVVIQKILAGCCLKEGNPCLRQIQASLKENAKRDFRETLIPMKCKNNNRF